MATMQRFDSIVQDSSGSAIPGATVTVRIKASGVLAVIYSDEGVTPITNPMTTTTNGSFWFYAANEDYTIAATYGGATFTLGDVTLHAPLEYWTTSFPIYSAAWRQFAYKTINEVVNNSNVLQDDDDLEFDVLNGETWEFKICLLRNAFIASDFKYRLNGPAGTGYHESVLYTTGNAICHIVYNTVGSTNTSTEPNDAGNMSGVIHGFFVATADGTVNFQWAQDTAVVEDTRVNIGSYLIARRVA